MSTVEEVGAWIEAELPGMLEEAQIPAASVALLADGHIVSRSAGLLNTATGVEATDDSVFQIGSITKVFTATLVMQLVDEGLVDLDRPLRQYVPDFTIADEAARDSLTVRQLLSHTAGFEGDYFDDTGMGDDCVEKFVPVLAKAPQLFQPGERFSYNNAGFIMLGRLVEVLRDAPYNTVLRERIAEPLGMPHFATDAYEAIRFRAAIGHVPGPDADFVPAPTWNLARSNSPAGSMLSMTAGDLLTFAVMHLDGGVAKDGTRVLSEESATAMQQPQVHLPDLGLLGTDWGLGWEYNSWDGGPVIGHDGNTVGQASFLRIVPGKNIAVAMLTNGGNPFTLYDAIMPRVLHELADVTVPPNPAPTDAAGPAPAAHRIEGTYSSSVSDSTVTVDEQGRIWLEQVMKGIFADMAPDPEPVELLPWRADTLVPRTPTMGMYMPHAFVGDDGEGRALYLHTGRADRRVSA
ncbi:serine hydrolase [Flexivirga endophytica]|uniref:Serine hydrolase n=1 Tax=Flexivirga endophytica TaxID=1849103 RepID=A0A916T341_9MICO|nr:serine hydrolase domain-containing protein [Flexivirga endophytica]GGB29029.1 serine hydrolase [Flexivirga endophytica]GHB50075.1 serine hydrolase [Flexivirga endophytica]